MQFWGTLALAAWSASVGGAKPTLVGKKIENFTLGDFRGKKVALDDMKAQKAVVVAFIGVDCPMAKLYAPKLAEMAKQYADKSVGFIAIDANQQDSILALSHYARKHGIEFPVLKDAGNAVADKFGATRTPEMFVLDADRVIRYHGRVDDQYGVGYLRPKAQKTELVDAIDAVLAGKPVRTQETELAGCIIGRARTPSDKSDVTYCKDIAPILQKRCAVCHRPGEIGPFPLTSYKEAVGWAEMIREVVQDERMPPWGADPKHGKFVNDPRLSAAEKKAIAKWAAAGAPEGNPSDLPAAIAYTPGWQIPKPDMVLEMPKSFEVPATGVVDYQFFVVDPGFKEDKWVRAAEARPGNPSVVHHIIVFVIPPEGRRRQRIGGVDNWLVATAPGANALDLPPGQAKFIPAGSKIAFQMHYTPNGTAAKDKSTMGMVFADAKTITKEVQTIGPFNRWFRIPPGADNYEVKSQFICDEDTTILQFFPHMHLRGKAFRYEAVYPDGKSEILLDVPKYDFGWQHTYMLEKPKTLPKGTLLNCIAHFDNSENNLSNPNPSETVRWGDQTWEEMMIGYFDAIPAAEGKRSFDPRQTRFQRFMKNHKDRIAIPDEVRERAKVALKTEDDFDLFASTLVEWLPMVDRVCLTTVDKGFIEVEMVTQVGEARRLGLNKGTRRPTLGLSLASYVTNGKPVVHQRLDQEGKGLDLRMIGRAFRSTCHYPMTYHGKPATLNIWIGEPNAMPPELVDRVKEVCELVKASGK